MDNSKIKYRVMIAYNEPDPETGEKSIDFLSEEAVKDEAEAVYDALQKSGHQVEYIAIQDLDNDLKKIRAYQPDVIFNLCEGFRGNARHEMHMAGFWELLGIPYTGNNALTLGIAQNKVLTKKLLESKKISTPMYQVFREAPVKTYLSYPLIAKPAQEDASLGITQKSVIENFDQLYSVVEELINRYRQPILVEKFIPGREFNVSILGNKNPRVLPISEINFGDVHEKYHRITSYEAKWLTDHELYKKTPAVCPADISDGLKSKLADTALRVYQLLNGRDYGRVDIRLDMSEKIYVLEYNPNPDISPDAGYSRSLKAAGIKYSEFVELLLREALERTEIDKYPKN